MKKAIDNFLLEPNGYYLQVKEWHYKACDGNGPAAALLAFLLFFHKHKQSMKEYARLTNEALKAKGRPPVADETDWQFHTDEMLKRKLFFWKEDTIRQARNFLRDEKGFIDTEAPAYLQSLYKTGRTKWFRVIVPAVQTWIINNYPLIEVEAEEILTMAPIAREYKKRDQYLRDAKRVFRFRQLYLGEEETVPVKSQLSKITARLKEGKDEIELAFAVIGNDASPWHKGDNPNSQGDNKVTYQLIKHIFFDADKITYFKNIAENAGWTRAKVIAKYEEVLNINYENRTSLEEKESTQSEADRLKENQMYRETASLLTELVINQRLKMDDILRQFYDRSDKLGFTLIDLSDAQRLGREIIDCLAQNEIVTADRQKRIMEFTTKFIQRLRGAE